MASFITYLKNVRMELTHVVWPEQRQVIGHVAIIILISVFTAILVAILDYLFTSGVGQIV